MIILSLVSRGCEVAIQFRKPGTCSGCGATAFPVHGLCFSWPLLAALFQVVPMQICSTHHSVNSLMIFFASSAVSPVLSLSHCVRLESLMPC